MKKVLLTLLVSLCFGVIGIIWIGCSEDGMNPGDELPGGAQESFIDNGDGTVTDNMTGLMWEKKVAGDSFSFDRQGIGSCLHCVDDRYDWNTAMSEWISTVNGHTNDITGSAQSGLGGDTDWRIPTLAELLTIVDCGSPPCIDPIFGPTAASFYWSATTNANFPGFAWFVDFDDGNVVFLSKDFSAHPRAVRNIQ